MHQNRGWEIELGAHGEEVVALIVCGDNVEPRTAERLAEERVPETGNYRGGARERRGQPGHTRLVVKPELHTKPGKRTPMSDREGDLH